MSVCRADVLPWTRGGSRDASLSGAIAQVAAGGRVETVDIGNGRWIDANTPAARTIAEPMVATGELS
jgi:hypothetical protein